MFIKALVNISPGEVKVTIRICNCSAVVGAAGLEVVTATLAFGAAVGE